MPERLLAKSRQQDRVLSVEAHCLDTEQTAIAVFSERTLDAWCRFFRLTDSRALLRDLRVACLFHDLGKANADFQAAVHGRREPQAIRHEHLSALVLCLPAVGDWLKGRGCDFDAIVAAVLSHHAKASGQKGDPWLWARTIGRGQSTINTGLHHPECYAILERVAAVIGGTPPWPLPADPWPSQSWDQVWQDGMQMANDLFFGNSFDLRRNHILAVKSGVIVADAVASGLWREDRDRDEFLLSSLHRQPLTGMRIRTDIIDRRIAQLGSAWKGWDGFQAAADDLGDRAAIVAGCGAGKTLAAWRWAAAVADRQAVGAVIFLYPTRATATEGFKDYVAWAPEAEATLLTGTASLDLAGMHRNPSDSTRGKIYEDETETRLFALANWKRTYFSATLDQFLAFLEHGYTGLCLLPQFADAALIIDEVHSFDRHLFARLLALLTHFRGPILLMSATITDDRLRALRAADVRIFPERDERTRYPGLAGEEDRLRYRLHRCADAAAAQSLARTHDVEKPCSTLWVVNTVKRCQGLAAGLRAEGRAPLVYHSRFTLRDRRRVHRTVVAAFQDPALKQWAITTQVCEMSLDLDADRLITEDAPLPALIQRLGRANRRRSRPRDFRAEVLTYRPEDNRPYCNEDGGSDAVVAAGCFAADRDGQELGQRDLALALADRRYVPDLPQPEACAGFLDGGWFATARPLRGEEDDRDVRCVLSTDLDRGLCEHGMPGDPEADPLEAWTIAVPRRFVISLAQDRGRTPPQRAQPAWLARHHLHLADGNRYDADLGFLLIDTE